MVWRMTASMNGVSMRIIALEAQKSGRRTSEALKTIRVVVVVVAAAAAGPASAAAGSGSLGLDSAPLPI